MSEYAPSEQGAVRRYSRRLVGRGGQLGSTPFSGMFISVVVRDTVGIREQFTPTGPFQELYTPTRRERASLNFRFSPLTPIAERLPRLSFVPPGIPVNKRALFIGLAIFLITSAIYKSGVVGWAVKMKAAELEGRVRFEDKDELVPLTLYESSLAEVEQLYARVMALETFQSQFNQQCLLRDLPQEREIRKCSTALSDCLSEFDALTVNHERAVSECKNSIVQLEVEQIQVLEKIEADFDWKLHNLLKSKNTELQNLEERLINLGSENESLRDRLDAIIVEGNTKDENEQVVSDERAFAGRRDGDSESILVGISDARQDDVDVLSAPIESGNEIIEADDNILATDRAVDQVDASYEAYKIATMILSGLVAVLAIVVGVLFVQIKYAAACVDASVVKPAALVSESSNQKSERDPAEEERKLMGMEDMFATIAREVQSRLDDIEKHHERDMSHMRAIVEETNRTSAEMSLLIKDVLEETSVVSTCNNSPCMSPYSIESSNLDGETSSLSVLLEASVTPIRVSTRDREPIAKTTSSVPTCYSIASPSRRSRERRSRRENGAGSDSSEAESEPLSVDEESDTEKENFARDMVNIWENFKH
jgi:hypothetical protein